MNYMPQSEFLQGARTLIENAATMPEISSALSVYGYTEERFQEGLDLLHAADALSKRRSAELGEKIEASSDFLKAWDKANVTYVKTLKIARIALGDDEGNAVSLKMLGARRQDFSGWYMQAGTFYANLLSEKSLVAKMGRFGYTRETLAQERADVDAVMDKHKKQAYEAGSAQASTAAKDRKFAELDSYVSDLRAVCEVAFYDAREQLEKLGPLAPIRRRRQAKRPVPTV